MKFVLALAVASVTTMHAARADDVRTWRDITFNWDIIKRNCGNPLPQPNPDANRIELMQYGMDYSCLALFAAHHAGWVAATDKPDPWVTTPDPKPSH